jgi:hypothetical protein
MLNLKSFKQFILENIDVEDLDVEFLKRAEKVTSLNLSISDFKSTKHKKEILFLFKKNFFPELHVSEISKDGEFSKEKFNSFVNKLSGPNLPMIFNYLEGSGVGPGEVVTYLAFEQCKLGGGNISADIIFSSKTYEMKAAKLSEGYLSDFLMGGTFNLNEVETKFFELARRAEVFDTPASISKSKTEKMKQMFPAEFKQIENKYAEICYKEYFSKHPVIFVGSKDSSNATKYKCIAVKEVKENEIFIERYTSKTLKPLIKV